jgi:hypothetical protein
MEMMMDRRSKIMMIYMEINHLLEIKVPMMTCMGPSKIAKLSLTMIYMGPRRKVEKPLPSIMIFMGQKLIKKEEVVKVEMDLQLIKYQK